MTINSINNTASIIEVDNIRLNTNTVSNLSGDLTLKTDGTDDIIFYNGTDNLMVITNDGQITAPLQPAFSAYANANVLNQTGNGTAATIAFNTEVFDIGNNFASNTFTAPVTGKYLLSTSVTSYNVTTGMTSQTLNINTSNASYSARSNPLNNSNSGSEQSIYVAVLADMDALDTATITLTIVGGAGDTVDIAGDATELKTYFSGILIS